MSPAELTELSAKLDILIRLVAVGLCGDRGQREKIAILESAGLQPKAIAEILRTTPNTVSVVLSAIRKERKKRTVGRNTKGESQEIA